MSMTLLSSYNPGLVTLSVLIAMVAAYTALDLAGRVHATAGRARWMWIIGGATAMGAGIWTMHFVGMLAFQLPMPIAYHAGLVTLSVLVAIGASTFALWMISRRDLGQLHLVVAALAMGAAIAGMHYVGMAAMHVDAELHYVRSLWWASIGIAVSASWVALNVARLLSTRETSRIRLIRAAAAVVMGFAIAGMHYTGMAAARFTTMAHVAANNPGALAPVALAIAVATAGLMVAGLALMASMLDRILQARTAEAELRAARDAALETSRAKSMFLSNMSHELRTPLNSVIGFANILLKNKAGNLSPVDIGYLGRIATNGGHLLGLINSILDLSKIEAGKIELEITPVDIGALARETVLSMEGQAMAKGLQVVADVPDALVPIDTDQTKLKQMLINLIGNALKFTTQGAITVRVIRDPGTGRPLRIDVADSGVGIPADRLAAVFEAFQQADSSTSRQFGGTGLGLTITRSLAQLMGFDVRVASTVGVGSTFSIVLDPNAPAELLLKPAARPVPAPVRVEAPIPEVRALGRLLTLIIDDDPDARLVLGQQFEELDCDVITAASADEGIALARRHHPDLITIDVMMPHKSGIEALHEFKTDPTLRDIPIVVVSVVAEDHKGRVLGAVDCLAKPVTREALVELLARNVVSTAMPRVLVVHKGQGTADDYQELFGSGVQLRVAGGVDEARADIDRAGTPSLIVLDVGDPATEIFPWIAAIRDDRRTTKVPLVVLVSDALARATSESLSGRATVLPRSDELKADLSGVLVGLRGGEQVRMAK